MKSFPKEAQRIMNERFGCDRLITIATSIDNVPYLRAVNAFYQDGSFYIITHAQSSKMKQMEINPVVAVCGEWFTGHGTAENMGYVFDEKNVEFYSILHRSFESWVNDAHINDSDLEPVILRIRMKTGILFSNGTRYDIDFSHIE